MKRTLLIVLAACLLLSACTRTRPAAGTPSPAAPVNTPSPAETDTDEAFYSETKNYILTGQDGVPENGRLHWSPSFLDAADLPAMYRAYRAAGGEAQDAAAFAAYLTQNAPAPSNWQELFERDLAASYSVEAARYDALGDGLYQVYVEIDGAQVPYVTLDSRTGWYHG